MTLNGGRSRAHRDLIEARRARVAELRLRRLTTRDIAVRLAEEQILNPETGESWSHVTVAEDLKALTAQWRREALADTAPIKAELWAELREVRRQAWEAGDLTTVLRALKQEAELLGLDAPLKVELEARIRELAAREGLDVEEAIEEARRVLRDARA
jgi:hypothetical protein